MRNNYTYDKEADILAFKIADEPFDHAEEMGDFIVHFNPKNEPVYLEILNASKFLKETSQALPAKVRQRVLA